MSDPRCPYCDTPIVEHEASRCLDAWTHMAVFEEPATPVDFLGRDEAAIIVPEDKRFEDCPRYSIRIEDAWRIAEHLAHLEHEVEVAHTPGILGYVAYVSKNRFVGAGEWPKEAMHADHAPLAICRAAILAVN